MARKAASRSPVDSVKAARRKSKPPAAARRGDSSRAKKSTGPAGEKVGKPALLEAVAGDTSISAAIDEAEKLVRAYPLPAIGAGLTIGLLLGLLMGRSS